MISSTIDGRNFMSIYTEILACAKEIREDLVIWRRHVHRMPELRMDTPLTEAYICDTLESFGIQTRLLGIAHGPAVTRFELQPAPGVKVSRITSLADDITFVLIWSIL